MKNLQNDLSFFIFFLGLSLLFGCNSGSKNVEGLYATPAGDAIILSFDADSIRTYNSLTRQSFALKYNYINDSLRLYHKEDTLLGLNYDSQLEAILPTKNKKEAYINKGEVFIKLMKMPLEQLINTYRVIDRYDVNNVGEFEIISKDDSLRIVFGDHNFSSFHPYALRGHNNTILGISGDVGEESVVFRWNRSDSSFATLEHGSRGFKRGTKLMPTINKTYDYSCPFKNYFLDLDNKSIGSFKVGSEMPSEIPEYFRIAKRTEYGQEASEILTYVVSEFDQELFKIYPEYDLEKNEFNNVIKEIQVVSEIIKPSSGLPVGSSINEFQRKYRDYQMWYSYVGGIFVIESRQANAQFLIRNEDYRGNKNLTSSDVVKLHSRDFRNGSRIQKIRIL